MNHKSQRRQQRRVDVDLLDLVLKIKVVSFMYVKDKFKQLVIIMQCV